MSINKWQYHQFKISGYTVCFLVCIVALHAWCLGYEQNEPAVHQAVIRGDQRVLEALLASGNTINAYDDSHWTALHHVFECPLAKRSRILQCLLDNGADVDARTSKGWTTLHLAISARDIGAMNLLIAHGADVNARTGNGVTAMRLAKYTVTMWDSLIPQQTRANADIIELLRRHHAAEP